MPDSVKLERRKSVSLVILNRPEVLNAINVAMRETLITLLGELNKDEAVRAIVITGTGERAFCSGQDLDETSKYGVGDIDAWLTRQHVMYAAVRDLTNLASSRSTAPPPAQASRSGCAPIFASAFRR